MSTDAAEMAVFATTVQLFEVDPANKSSWRRVHPKPVTLMVNFNILDNAYLVRAVDDEDRYLVDGTLQPGVAFKKASAKFGQWEDAAGVVHGVNFASEDDIGDFEEILILATEGRPPAGVESAAEHAAMSAGDVGAGVGGTARALYDFKGADESQLSFSAGQVIVDVMDTKAEAWLEGSIVEGTIQRNGVFPRNYAQLLAPGSAEERQAQEEATARALVTARTGNAGNAGSAGASAGMVRAAGQAANGSATSSADMEELVRLRARVEQLQMQLNAKVTDGALRAENLRLKKALADSSSHVKEWEAELSVLKNNNARLLAALQESFGGVEVWKAQLTLHADQNSKMLGKMRELNDLSNKMQSVMSQEL